MSGGRIERANEEEIGGVLEGNTVAISSLKTPVLVALIGASVIITLSPFAGRSRGLPASELGVGICYFAAIGVGFLLVQVRTCSASRSTSTTRATPSS